VGWPNFVYLPDWVGLVRYRGAVISGWRGVVEKVRPETENPPAKCFSGGGCLGFRSKTKVLHLVRPKRHTRAPRTTCTGLGALLCAGNHVHFFKRTLCARQVLFHGSHSFGPRWSEGAPHAVAQELRYAKRAPGYRPMFQKKTDGAPARGHDGAARTLRVPPGTVRRRPRLFVSRHCANS